MRPTRILLAAALALAFPTPANALSGACIATSIGVDETCVPRMVCDAGDLVTVVVAGHGTGLASCGGSTAACPANPGCTDTATAGGRGTLGCSVDPWASDDVVALCLVTPGAR